MSAPHVAVRYMTRFACVGSACEETCCSGGWSITVDDVHHGKLVQIMSRSRAERAELAAAVELADPAVRSPMRHAHIKLKPDGSCTFLQDDKLCSIYRRYGDRPVPDTCAIFPRFVAKIGERVELLGTLACPETARLALLSDDGFALEPLALESLPRDRGAIAVSLSAGVYEACFDDIRLTILEVIGRTGLPLAVRLFLCAYLGERTHGYFHRGATTLDGARLATDLATFLHPEVGEKWRAVLGEVRTPGARAGRVLMRVLRERLVTLPAVASLRQLMRSILDSLAAEGAASGDGDTYSFDPERIIAVHTERRARWEADHGARIDRALTNLARQFWMKEPYTASPDLRAHAQKLILRMALVRFLLFSHPLLVGAAVEGGETLVDRAVVDVAQKLARALEHNRAFAEGLDELLATLELRTLAEAVFLLQI
jgi:lysine-N-methylase